MNSVLLQLGLGSSPSHSVWKFTIYVDNTSSSLYNLWRIQLDSHGWQYGNTIFIAILINLLQMGTGGDVATDGHAGASDYEPLL
jgi:hypothetical protein